jgi:hypothetical protein
MDFPAYPDWNPFIRRIAGSAEIGAALEVVIQPPGRAAQTFHPTVLACDPGRYFAWRGTLPVPGLFSGEHRFALHGEAGGTRFEHSEAFGGLLVAMLGGMLAATEDGFRQMNEALRRRCLV